MAVEGVKGFPWGRILEAIGDRDPALRAHCQEVGSLSFVIARAMDVPLEQVHRCYLAGLVHDVGKVLLPQSILGAARRLTPVEHAIVATHPVTGAAILEAWTDTKDLAPSVRHHHERWDGSGYPDGLAGEAIPLFARIISIADAYSVMTAGRPYAAPLTSDTAVWELARGAGSQFDPRVLGFLMSELDNWRAHRADDTRRRASLPPVGRKRT